MCRNARADYTASTAAASFLLHPSPPTPLPLPSLPLLMPITGHPVCPSLQTSPPMGVGVSSCSGWSPAFEAGGASSGRCSSTASLPLAPPAPQNSFPCARLNPKPERCTCCRSTRWTGLASSTVRPSPHSHASCLMAHVHSICFCVVPLTLVGGLW